MIYGVYYTVYIIKYSIYSMPYTVCIIVFTVFSLQYHTQYYVVEVTNKLILLAVLENIYSATLGRVGHRVAMSVGLCVC